MENVSDELGSLVAKTNLKLLYNITSLRFFVARFLFKKASRSIFTLTLTNFFSYYLVAKVPKVQFFFFFLFLCCNVHFLIGSSPNV
jgi:hypothetical protein